MKGPDSARKEAARPASYRALSSTAQLRAPGSDSHLGDRGFRESRGLHCRCPGMAEKREDADVAGGQGEWVPRHLGGGSDPPPSG